MWAGLWHGGWWGEDGTPGPVQFPALGLEVLRGQDPSLTALGGETAGISICGANRAQREVDPSAKNQALTSAGAALPLGAARESPEPGSGESRCPPHPEPPSSWGAAVQPLPSGRAPRTRQWGWPGARGWAGAGQGGCGRPRPPGAPRHAGLAENPGGQHGTGATAGPRRGRRGCVGAAAPGAGVYSRLCVGESCLVTAAPFPGPLPGAALDADGCLNFSPGSSEGRWTPWMRIPGGCTPRDAHLGGCMSGDAHLGGCTPRGMQAHAFWCQGQPGSLDQEHHGLGPGMPPCPHVEGVSTAPAPPAAPRGRAHE